MKVQYCSMICLLLMIGLLTGCEASAPTARTYSLQRLPDIPSVTVFRAAEKAVAERYRIDQDQTSRNEGVIISEPIESVEAVPSLRVGDVLGAKRRVRRFVEVRIVTAQDGTQVFCKVPIQVCETDERALYSRPQRGSTDYPSDTPADRDAATTPEQNTYWCTRNRDKVQEREILESIRELIGVEDVSVE